MADDLSKPHFLSHRKLHEHVVPIFLSDEEIRKDFVVTGLFHTAKKFCLRKPIASAGDDYLGK